LGAVENVSGNSARASAGRHGAWWRKDLSQADAYAIETRLIGEHRRETEGGTLWNVLAAGEGFKRILRDDWVLVARQAAATSAGCTTYLRPRHRPGAFPVHLESRTEAPVEAWFGQAVYDGSTDVLCGSGGRNRNRGNRVRSFWLYAAEVPDPALLGDRHLHDLLPLRGACLFA
jgi:hypothetical protein